MDADEKNIFITGRIIFGYKLWFFMASPVVSLTCTPVRLSADLELYSPMVNCEWSIKKDN